LQQFQRGGDLLEAGRGYRRADYGGSYEHDISQYLLYEHIKPYLVKEGYIILNRSGQGGSGVVLSVERNGNNPENIEIPVGTKCILKVIQIEQGGLTTSMVQNEYEIQRKLSDELACVPSILGRLPSHDFSGYEITLESRDPKKYKYYHQKYELTEFYLMEKIVGYELFDCIVKLINGQNTTFNKWWTDLGDNVIKRILWQLVDAIEVIHGQDVIHLDLKPENIMITSPAKGKVKVYIIDYGGSIMRANIRDIDFSNGKFTVQYTAPEINSPQRRKQLKDNYTENAITSYETDHLNWKNLDIWALGAIIWVVSFGAPYPKTGIQANWSKLIPTLTTPLLDQHKANVIDLVELCHPEKSGEYSIYPTFEQIKAHAFFEGVGGAQWVEGDAAGDPAGDAAGDAAGDPSGSETRDQETTRKIRELSEGAEGAEAGAEAVRVAEAEISRLTEERDQRANRRAEQEMITVIRGKPLWTAAEINFIRHKDLIWRPTQKACDRCSTEYGLFTWKHHCRSCGRSICSNCLGSTDITLYAWISSTPGHNWTLGTGGKEKQVCKDCFEHKDKIWYGPTDDAGAL